jgi:hypothetical protein
MLSLGREKTDWSGRERECPSLPSFAFPNSHFWPMDWRLWAFGVYKRVDLQYFKGCCLGGYDAELRKIVLDIFCIYKAALRRDR